MKKNHKLEADFSPEEFVVMKKMGSDVVVRSQLSGKEFRRNVSHLKKVPDQRNEGQTVSGSEAAPSGHQELARDLDPVQSRDETRYRRERHPPPKFSDYVPH